MSQRIVALALTALLTGSSLQAFLHFDGEEETEKITTEQLYEKLSGPKKERPILINALYSTKDYRNGKSYLKGSIFLSIIEDTKNATDIFNIVPQQLQSLEPNTFLIVYSTYFENGVGSPLYFWYWWLKDKGFTNVHMYAGTLEYWKQVDTKGKYLKKEKR